MTVGTSPKPEADGMAKHTIVTIVGARPQFIKVAPVSAALAKHAGLTELLIHSGQHYDAQMSDVFFDELNIQRPHINLAVGSGTHGAQTGVMLQQIEAELLRVQPKLVLVYGDTNTTMAAALAAVKLHIPVAHVEAGLRCYWLEVPEEVNRRVTDHVSTLLFTPTDVATRNLLAEGFPKEAIHQVGDVMLDAVRLFTERARKISTVQARVGVRDGEYLLATIHRPNHTDDDAIRSNLLEAFARLSEERTIVLPAHPRLRSRLTPAELERIESSNILLCPPVGYLDMLRLELGATGIVTDSGGVQREAFFVERPCVTVRSNASPPEWPELVEMGWNRYANPTTVSDVVDVVRAQLAPTTREVRPMFGDGHAAQRIADSLVRTIE